MDDELPFSTNVRNNKIYSPMPPNPHPLPVQLQRYNYIISPLPIHLACTTKQSIIAVVACIFSAKKKFFCGKSFSF